MDSNRSRSSDGESVKATISYKQEVKRTQEIVDALCKFSGLETLIVRGILEFSRALCEPETSLIHENTFRAQMSRTFRIGRFLQSNMFRVAQKLTDERSTPNILTVNQFCRLICVFLSPELKVKTNFVFDVYDLNRDGDLQQCEIYKLMRNCIISDSRPTVESDEYDYEQEEMEADLRELVEIVISFCDVSGKKSVDRDEFHKMVEKNRMLLQAFGECLPKQSSLNLFMQRIEQKTAPQLQEEFRNERVRCLNLPYHILEKKSVNYYPFRLQFE